MNPGCFHWKKKKENFLNSKWNFFIHFFFFSSLPLPASWQSSHLVFTYKITIQLLFCCVLFHWTTLGGRSLLTISTRTGGRGEEKADMKRLWKWQHYRWNWRQESDSHRSNEICVLLPREFHLFHFESHFPSFFMGACARETLWKCC